jgi:tRNA threonylcarbamoyladenosine modification (KEOPS) complex Cgi121 subunit
LLKTLNDEKPGQVNFQLFDARLVATWEHLYFAAINALMAFRGKRNISKSVAVETLLYASAQNQIQKAMRLLGVKLGSSDIAVLIVAEQSEPVQSMLSVISENVGRKRDDRVLELSEEKSDSIRRFFRVSDNQLRAVKRGASLERALVDLVIEQVALVSVRNQARVSFLSRPR